MRRLEAIVAASFATILWLLLACLLYLFGIRGHGADSSFVAQIFYNFKSQLWMTSSLVSSILEAMRTLWYQPGEFVCGQPLFFEGTDAPLTFHMYLIGYLLIPLARMLPPDVLIAALHAFIYVSVPLFAYVLARSLKIGILNSLLLALLVVQHPLWQEGLFGQFYFNKLFLPLCALLVWLVTREHINLLAVWLVAALAASTTEIYGLIVGTMLVGYLAIRRDNWRNLLSLAFVCVLFSAVGLAATQLWGGSSSTQDGVIASTVGGGIAGFFANRTGALMTPGTLAFVGVNGAELALVALGSGAQLALAGALMLPNLLVTIGGAEKTGWSTHYHVSYWIPLIWASVVGASRLQARSGLALSALVIALVAFSSVLDPSRLHLREPVLTPIVIATKLLTYSRSASADFAYRDALRAAIKPGETVSGPEPAFYNLVDHQLSYYPLNVDRADRVIFVFDQNMAGDAHFQTINYGQQDDRLDSCIVDRMRREGFDFDHPQVVERWGIVGRAPSGSAAPQP
jgi:hypothetical protein